MPSTEPAPDGWRISGDKTKALSNGQSPQGNPTSTLKGWSLGNFDILEETGELLINEQLRLKRLQ